jgi:uncharacterized protein (TIGR00288 family)
MVEQKQNRDQQIAVLIDHENVGLAPMQSLFAQLADYGQIVLKRAYADWSNANNSKDQILELGIEPVHFFRSRKNTSDIRLTIDAIEILFNKPLIDTFVIVSSDSDYLPLINKLRSSGKKVYIAGDKTKVTGAVSTSCDAYFDIKQNETAELPPKPKKTVKKKASPPETEKKPDVITKPQIDSNLAEQVNQAWSKKATVSGKSIPGPNAAADAVSILGIENLKNSPYKTLQGVLNASALLTKYWSRNKNTIVRK